MTIRILALAAGSAVSLAAASAWAQNTTDPTRPRPTTPGDTATRTNATADAQNILRDLVGVWKVEVSIHDPSWVADHAGKGLDQKRDAQPDGQNNPDRDATPADPDRNQPDRDANKPANAAPTSSMGGKMGGVTRSSMFGSILRSHTVLAAEGLDSKPVPADASPTSRHRAGSPSRNDDGLFRGLFFLGFNEGAREYSAVFMDDQRGEINYRTGTYDATSKRIVFEGGRGSGSSMNPIRESGDPTRDPARTTPTDRTRPQPSTNTGMGWSGHEGHRVVLEIMDPNNYRVTMYDASGGTTTRSTPTTSPTTPTPSSPAPSTTPGTPPSNTPTTPPSTTPPSTTPGTPPSTTPSTPTAAQPSGEFGRIVYQANYSRLNSTDEAKYREWIELGDKDNTKAGR